MGMIREALSLSLALAVFVALAATRAAAAADATPDEALKNLPLARFVDATSLEQLANMVVTDTKVAQAPTTVTQSILVLRHEDFDRQPDVDRNLAELLRYTSGQFVNVLSRNDANWGSYGGLGPKYNSYLLDGLPIDSFADAMSLDSEAIERVEVQKGPASVLYSNYLTMDFAGNETPLAGTTNFVLKDRIDAPLTRLSAGIGSYGSYAGRAYRQDRSGNLSYLFGAVAERSDYTQYGAPNSWLQTVKTPEYDKTKLFGKLSYALDRPDHTLSLFVHQTRHEGDVGRPHRDFENRYDTLNFAYNNPLSQTLHFQFKVGERRYDRQSGNDNYPSSLASTGHDDTRQVIRPLDLTLSYLHGRDSLLTAGIDGQSVHYQTESRSNVGVVTRENDIDARSAGCFLQEKLQWQDWVLRAGVRHNVIHHEYSLLGGISPATTDISWTKDLWSLGVRYNMSPSVAIYANAGSSFMAPAGKQIGGTISAPTANGQLANPALKPETGVGRDIGFDWQPISALDVGLRAFLNTIASAIVDNVVSTTPSQTRSENAGSARASGLELDMRHSLAESMSWFANVTLTQTRVQNPNDSDQDGTAIPFAPDNVLNLGLSANWPGAVTVSPYYHRVGRYYDSTSRGGRAALGNYGVLNLRLQQNWRRGIDLVLDLNNIGNRRYDLPFGFRDPGFSGFARLDFGF
jgi:iron complex outermembrane receptor protein